MTYREIGLFYLKFFSVFAPKYRREVVDKAVCRHIIEIVKKLCKETSVGIIKRDMPGDF